MKGESGKEVTASMAHCFIANSFRKSNIGDLIRNSISIVTHFENNLEEFYMESF